MMPGSIRKNQKRKGKIFFDLFFFCFSAYSQFRLNVLFFMIFVFIGKKMYEFRRSIRQRKCFSRFDLIFQGIYSIQNLISAVVYRAFRGYFLDAIRNSIVRRRIAARASFEILRKKVFDRDEIPIAIVGIVVKTASIDRWHREKLEKVFFANFSSKKKVFPFFRSETRRNFDGKFNDQSGKISRLDENSRRNETFFVSRGKFDDRKWKFSFDSFKTIFSLSDFRLDRLFSWFHQHFVRHCKNRTNVRSIFAEFFFSQCEVSLRQTAETFSDVENQTKPVASLNFALISYFFVEVLLKIWSFGPRRFFRISLMNRIETFLSATCFVKKNRFFSFDKLRFLFFNRFYK